MSNEINNEVKYKEGWRVGKMVVKDRLTTLEIHLAEHCNLNCFSCDNFSNLADEAYTDLRSFNNDMQRMAEISKGEIDAIILLGGEPLLNKNCKDYFYITRKHFKLSAIWLITNGILLLKQDESFWSSLAINNVTIRPTKYPIKVDWDAIEVKCKEYDVKLEFFNNTSYEKTSWKTVLDPTGSQNPLDSFNRCFKGNNCTTLKDGKIYTCEVSANIHHFNKFFKQNLEKSEKDYIDIHDRSITYKDILEFIAKPVPFCKYCDTRKEIKYSWSVGRKELSEYYSYKNCHKFL